MTYHIDFDAAPDDTLGALEAVLAVARRGGLQLAGLLLDQQHHGASVALALQAEETDRLDLFATRVANLVGVAKIVSVCK